MSTISLHLLTRETPNGIHFCKAIMNLRVCKILLGLGLGKKVLVVIDTWLEIQVQIDNIQTFNMIIIKTSI